MRLLVFFFFLVATRLSTIFSQKILREVIGSSGNSGKTNGLALQATVGQSSLVSSEKINDYLFLSQGFNKSRFVSKKIDDWEVFLFPNPNNGNFSFSTTLNMEEKIDFSIYDAAGRLIQIGNGYGQEKINVNLQNAVAGIYFMRVSTYYYSITLKIDVIQ
ncbi:MAG: T9SS C-terminal target domain-containing protein [Flavobacteriales bacterium]|nr:T9SS C-terminal target domain-containing protein [Flavobacteriales bacterium]